MLEVELHISDRVPKGGSRYDDLVGRVVYASPAGQTQQPTSAVPEFPANSLTCVDVRVDYRYLCPGSWLGMVTLASVWAHTARELVAQIQEEHMRSEAVAQSTAPVFLVS